MKISWKSELSELLSRLSKAQQELLSLLSIKHDLLQQRDHEGLASLLPKEQSLCAELQSCQELRKDLLKQASQEGLPADSIQALASALPEGESRGLKEPLEQAANRSRLLQHQSLTQWVVVQRTLLHLSQMLEIIATGGRSQPTYGKGGIAESSGALMDREV